MQPMVKHQEEEGKVEGNCEFTLDVLGTKEYQTQRITRIGTICEPLFSLLLSLFEDNTTCYTSQMWDHKIFTHQFEGKSKH